MLTRLFFRGLLYGIPVAVTVYVLVVIFVKLDNLIDTETWFGTRIPGMGVAVVIAAITLLGLATSSFLTRWIVNLIDRAFKRLPGAKIIYSAIKDLLAAFVGEQKRFDRPVLVSVLEGKAQILGFITQQELGWLGHKEKVAVYFPQSYNFAGQLLIFPHEQVEVLDAEAGAVMQFIVSGGVSTKTKD